MANTSPGMNLTGTVRFDLSVPNPRANVSIFPLLPPLKQPRGARWRRYSKNWNISLSNVLSNVSSFPAFETLRNKGDGRVSAEFNLFRKLASRGSLRLNPEKLYRSVYESFHPTSAPSFPSDYHSVIVARFLATETLKLHLRSVKKERKKEIRKRFHIS